MSGNDVAWEKCFECDGKGHHAVDPSSICPVCKGKGRVRV